MNQPVTSSAQIILLAIRLTDQADIPGLCAITSKYPKVLQTEILLRILLSHLPETLEAKRYVPLLELLASGQDSQVAEAQVGSTALLGISHEEAEAKARKLHLLPLAWPHAPYNRPKDTLLLFLFHRSLRIDKNSGLISEIPPLLAPFFSRYPILRIWVITTILPLLRLNYEYYPFFNHYNDSNTITISAFEKLEHKAKVQYLLSKTGNDKLADPDFTISRDIRGLVGPCIYGETLQKQQRQVNDKPDYICPPEAQQKPLSTNEKNDSWEELYRWIHLQASVSWKTAVEAIEGWNGPDDYDLGEYDIGDSLNEEHRIHLKIRYAQVALATAYSITEKSKNVLKGIERIIVRIISLMEQPPIPNLETACELLIPVTENDMEIYSQSGSINLKTLTDKDNLLTKPSRASINLLHAFLVSASLCGRFGCQVNIRYLAELAFNRDENKQKQLFQNIIQSISLMETQDDYFLQRTRSELLWLWSWGSEKLVEGKKINSRLSILGLLSNEYIEKEFLRVLLVKSRCALAHSIYESEPNQPLSRQILHDTVIEVAIYQYDSATNANRYRAGLKKCEEILKSFPGTLSKSLERIQLEYLLQLTSKIEPYRLVLKNGEPFQPICLRMHLDPISILGKILEQNPKSYKDISLFIEMAQLMVRAGLNKKEARRCPNSISAEMNEDLVNFERRIVSMCIDAALFEDDFEIAYLYVATQLKRIGGAAQARSIDSDRRNSDLIYKTIDDWSWRAALQVGKYRPNTRTIKPTRMSHTDETQSIHYLEKCLDCLSTALKLAPKGTLQEILNVYRRCEEELEMLLIQEAEEVKTWDLKADNQMMPGGFTLTPAKQNTLSNPSPLTEEPVSLFDLSRASMLRAQNGFSAFSILRGKSKKDEAVSENLSEKSEENIGSTVEVAGAQITRKRDQLKNAAVGGLATGVGWLIGAPVPRTGDND